MQKKNHDEYSPTRDPGSKGARELIVITNAEAGLRTERGAVTSASNADVAPLKRLVTAAGAKLNLLFGDSEEQLHGEVARFAVERPADTPDLSTFYHVEASEERLDELAELFLEQDLVEAAYVKPAAELAKYMNDEDGTEINIMEPSSVDAPPATPDFTVRQIYLNPAPAGIDARYAWTKPGGRGDGIRIIDLEWGWNFSHEDLLQGQGGVLAGTNSSNNDHGTAVLGEFSGDPNSVGITGICPNAIASAVAFSMPTATAIRTAADRLRRGDIILLEIHRPGPRYNFQGRTDQKGYIAIEWWPDDFAAIRYAVQRGIIVVEAAGNGAENLDSSVYNSRPSGFPQSWTNPFDPSNPSSEAVVVGAGAPPPGTHGRDHGPDRSRLGFSNYGSRIDCQGWGREVTTTGYGDLQGGPLNRRYTDAFSGTSSASPIVVGALGALQGIRHNRGLGLLTSASARSVLRATGSPQQDATGRPKTQRIGNRPDLRQLIQMLPASTRYSGVFRAGSGQYGLWANASWSSFLQKWQQWNSQGMRLVDFDTTGTVSSQRYSGVFQQGSGAYGLWVNASWSSFVQKWQQWNSQGLRLIDFEISGTGSSQRYSGVFRQGSGSYGLWVNASWSSFVQKWQQWSSQGLRLIDLKITGTGSSQRYSGVFRQGSGGHGLWVNASWSSFVQKWQQWNAQGLRLIDFEISGTGSSQRYSGVFRTGSGAYGLWVNANWDSFVDKWQQWSSQGMRLIDMDVTKAGQSPSAPMIDLEPDASTEEGDGFGGASDEGAAAAGAEQSSDGGFGQASFDEDASEIEVADGMGEASFAEAPSSLETESSEGFGEANFEQGAEEAGEIEDGEDGFGEAVMVAVEASETDEESLSKSCDGQGQAFIA